MSTSTPPPLGDVSTDPNPKHLLPYRNNDAKIVAYDRYLLIILREQHGKHGESPKPFRLFIIEALSPSSGLQHILHMKSMQSSKSKLFPGKSRVLVRGMQPCRYIGLYK